MPNKSFKKTSKVMIVPKQSKKKGSRASKKPESVAQFALRAGLNSMAAYGTGGLPYAVGTAGADLYDFMRSSGPTTYQNIAAPSATGSSIKGSLTSSFSVQPAGNDTVRVRGSVMAMRITVGVTGTIYAYDTAGNFHAMSAASGGGYSVALRNAGNLGTLSAYGYPNNLCPTNSQLTPYAGIYTKWRPEALRFRYIPSCPSSQVGVVSIAWTDIAVPLFDNTWATPRVFGGTPYTFGIMSQHPAFASGPAWQPHDLAVRPRTHGICENPKDWLSVSYNESTTPGYVVGADSTTYPFGGSLIVAVENAGSIYAAETTLGYIIYDYDYSLHDSGPVKFPNTGLYSPVNMLDLKQNSDLLTELTKRSKALEARCGYDLDKLALELKHCELGEAEEYLSVSPHPSVPQPPTPVVSRASTPVPSLLPRR